VSVNKVCIVGASGKLGRYMMRHCLDRGYEVVGVCRERSVDKLAEFKDRITLIPGATNDRRVIEKAVSGCDGVLAVLVPWVAGSIPRAPPRRCSTMRLRTREWYSPAAGI
jgi:nucleoside-diphosphate-sugar epimerase